MHARIVILTTEINPAVVTAMVKAARSEIAAHEATLVDVVKTTGVLDMPVVAHTLFSDESVDGVVVLGAVAKGETKHDELVVNMMTSKLIDFSVEYTTPVGFGVIGPGATPDMFMPRADEYARRAVQAVLRNIELLRS